MIMIWKTYDNNDKNDRQKCLENGTLEKILLVHDGDSDSDDDDNYDNDDCDDDDNLQKCLVDSALYKDPACAKANLSLV